MAWLDPPPSCYTLPAVSSDNPNGRTLTLDESAAMATQVGDALRAKFRPALIVMSGQNVGARFEVLGTVTIGRDPDNQLSLPDPRASFRHAYLEDRGGQWAIVDLGSTNGTVVNGVRVKEAVLRHGDKLRFGETLVRFEVQDEADQAFADTISNLINIDDLTGLYLRRRFDAELVQLLARARLLHAPLSLLAMDLDGIKAINDTHGHLFGAFTIAQAGKLIGAQVQAGGIATRFGGDEFIAALPGCDLAQGLQSAQAIRQAIERHAFILDGIALRPTVSIGVACFPAHAQDARALFGAADAALYVAKRAGKNRVVEATVAFGG